MDTFFHPKSIAVFGVSDTSSNLARVIVENLVRFGFSGDVYPVGVSAGVVAGKKICLSIDGVPGVPDLAVVLVPARFAPETLEACGKKGIKSVVLESGGFSEFSGQRRDLEDAMRSIAHRYGMKVIGPNCFGIVNVEAGVVLPFFIIDPEYMKKGSASLISQSGGVFYDTCMLCSVENVGLRKLVSIGNKLMTNENDILEYVLEDGGTRVVGLYLENFSDGRRFMDIASGTDKPIVVLKANRSQSSGEIAKFHTTALAGDDDVADAALRQSGLIRVSNFQEMIDCFKVFSLPVLRGKRLALISRSGGHGVLSADSARRHGFEFPRFSDAFLQKITAKKLNVIAATNPLDIGDVYDLDEYGPILEMALAEEGIDGAVFVITYSSESDGGKVRNFLRHVPAIIEQYGKPVAVCVVTNRSEWFAVKEAGDLPVFVDVDQAMKAFAWSCGHYRAKMERRRKAPPPVVTETIASEGRRLLEPEKCFDILSRAGLPVAAYAIAEDSRGAVAAAERLGFPVVLKAADAGLLHKSEAKGVVLDISDRKGLEAALGNLNAKRYLLQTMVPPGREVIIGGRRDNEFGPVIVCGLGGIYVEIIADRAIRVAPVDDETAGELIAELKGLAILKGARGRKAVDLRALRDIIVGVSELLARDPAIVNLDINPVIVHDEGEGCVIVDAKIEVSG